MEEIIRNVRDLGRHERKTLENAIGHALREDQRIILRLITPPESESKVDVKATEQANPSPDEVIAEPPLPDWCDVFRGLSSSEIDAIDEILRHRADLTRMAC